MTELNFSLVLISLLTLGVLIISAKRDLVWAKIAIRNRKR